MEPVAFFKCLSDATRLSCMMLIFQEGELCVCELMDALEESQPKISRHLAHLRNSGLLCDRRAGQWVYYSINPDLPEWALNILEQAMVGDQNTLSATFERRPLKPQHKQQC